MSMTANGERLASLTKELMSRWQQTREQWMDVKAREFEEHYLIELDSTVRTAAHAIQNLEGILRKIRSDCE